jgi:hypothetical protein
MRIRLLILMLLFLTFANISKGQVLLEILKALANENTTTETASKNNKPKYSTRNLITTSFIVNSSSKARSSDGKTREVVKINLPKGTKKWYYRVTVLNVNSNYTYQDNESFHYLLSKNKFMNTYKPTDEAVDFYILGHSGDVESFLVTGNDNFKVYQAYTKKATNSFIGECALVQENLW